MHLCSGLTCTERHMNQLNFPHISTIEAQIYMWNYAATLHVTLVATITNKLRHVNKWLHVLLVYNEQLITYAPHRECAERVRSCISCCHRGTTLCSQYHQLPLNKLKKYINKTNMTNTCESKQKCMFIKWLIALIFFQKSQVWIISSSGYPQEKLKEQPSVQLHASINFLF